LDVARKDTTRVSVQSAKRTKKKWMSPT